MKQNKIKLSLVCILATSLFGGEIDYGKGSFKIKGGFIGLDKQISTDVTTYSLVEQHKNLFSSNWYYKYNLTWYDSKDMVNTQNSINTYSNSTQNPITKTTPAIDYRPQGLDVNLVLGRDLSHKNENQYFGVGVLVGISLPWIDSKKDSNNNDNNSDNSMNLMKKSKTKLYTYKIGPSVTTRVALNNFFTIYGSATYAYQTGKIKNNYLKSDLSVNGIFQEYDVGIRFQPFSYDYKLGWITISPRLYATLGYRYTSWKLKDISLDITGANVTFDKSDFEMKANVTYFGIGYSF